LLLFDLKPKDSRADFYGRGNELNEIVGLIEKGSWVVVLGPRMVGKTSLVKVACNDLAKQYRYAYLNLWGVKTANAFLEALAHGINQSRTLYQKIRNALSRIEEFSVGPDSFSIKISREPMTRIWDIIAAVGSLKDDSIFVLDEVQELYPISRQMLELLANIFNTYKNITFVFTGSMMGLVRALLEPKSTSPLYGRSPAKMYIKPFDGSQSVDFVRRGFKEYGRVIDDSKIKDVVDNLNGIPGWLTLYGNYAAVRKLSHDKAMEETKKEARKIVKDELNHFLQGKDRGSYIQALRSTSNGARWADIKDAIKVRKRSAINDKKVQCIIDNLLNHMLITHNEKDNIYTVTDPLVRYTVKGLR